MDPFGRTSGLPPPDAMDRQQRIAVLGAAFAALRRGEMPEPIACRLLAEAGERWLSTGGTFDLAAGVQAPRASTATPARLWLRIRPLREDGNEPENQGASTA